MRQNILDNLKTDFDKALAQLYAAGNRMLKAVRHGIQIGAVKQDHFDNNDEMQGLFKREAYTAIMKDGGMVFMYIQSHSTDELSEELWNKAVIKVETLTEYAFRGASYWEAQAEVAETINGDFASGATIEPVEPIKEVPNATAKNRMRGDILPEDLN